MLILNILGGEVSFMRKKYKTLKHYLTEIVEKMNQQNIQYEEWLQGFCVKGQDNMKKFREILVEYKQYVDLPKEAWDCLNIGIAPNGYVWNLRESEMGVNGSGYPFQRFHMELQITKNQKEMY